MNEPCDHSRDVVSGVDAYLKRLRQVKFSDKSIRSYRNALKKFFSFLAEKLIQDVTVDDLERYRHTLLTAEFSEHTIELYLRVVRMFFHYLEDQSSIFINPAASFIIPKPKRNLGWVLSSEDIQNILAVPDLSTPLGQRDRAILELAYTTGVRIGELANLSVYDVDSPNQTVRVLGKGKRERTLPLGKHTVRYLKAYLQNTRPKLLKNTLDTEALWISNHTGKKLSDDGIAQVLKQIGKVAGLSQNLSCHVFRRTCASEMLRNGAHPEMVKRMLGHNSMKTLSQYLQVTINDIRNMHKNSRLGK